MIKTTTRNVEEISLAILTGQDFTTRGKLYGQSLANTDKFIRGQYIDYVVWSGEGAVAWHEKTHLAARWNTFRNSMETFQKPAVWHVVSIGTVKGVNPSFLRHINIVKEALAPTGFVEG